MVVAWHGLLHARRAGYRFGQYLQLCIQCGQLDVDGRWHRAHGLRWHCEGWVHVGIVWLGCLRIPQ
jgi:hypothetical protein